MEWIHWAEQSWDTYAQMKTIICNEQLMRYCSTQAAVQMGHKPAATWRKSSNVKVVMCTTWWRRTKIGPGFFWLVVWTPLKNISQLGWLFPIYGKKCSKPPTSLCNVETCGNPMLFHLLPWSHLKSGGLNHPFQTVGAWFTIGLAMECQVSHVKGPTIRSAKGGTDGCNHMH